MKPPRPDSENLFALLVVVIAVMGFNHVAVFGCKALLHDDPIGFYLMTQSSFSLPGLLADFLYAPESFSWRIMAYSPPLARLIYVVCLMIPISFLYYYLLTAKLGLPRAPSLFAAITPHILPLQWAIPAGINMSYPLKTFFLVLVSLLLAMRFMGEMSWPRRVGHLFLLLTTLALAAHSSEQFVFLIPPFLLLLLFHRGRLPEKATVLALFAGALAVRTSLMILFPRKTAFTLEKEAVLERLDAYLTWSMPLPWFPGPLLLAAVTTILIAAVLLVLTGRARLKPTGAFIGVSDKSYALLVYLFLLVFAAVTIAVFLFQTRYFLPRYTYLFTFPLLTAIGLSLHFISDALGVRRSAAALLFAVIVLVSGAARLHYLGERYEIYNTNYERLARTVQGKAFPPRSQIVVVLPRKTVGEWYQPLLSHPYARISGLSDLQGGWYRSSGRLRFMLNRRDVTGLIIITRPRFNAADHFDPAVRGGDAEHHMTGLNLQDPLFLYRLTGDDSAKQILMALQWKDDEGWTIWRFDQRTGKGARFVEGRGAEGLRSTLEDLKTKGVDLEDILWAEPALREITTSRTGLRGIPAGPKLPLPIAGDGG